MLTLTHKVAKHWSVHYKELTEAPSNSWIVDFHILSPRRKYSLIVHRQTLFTILQNGLVKSPEEAFNLVQEATTNFNYTLPVLKLFRNSDRKINGSITNIKDFIHCLQPGETLQKIEYLINRTPFKAIYYYQPREMFKAHCSRTLPIREKF